jgi:hypothetical protein
MGSLSFPVLRVEQAMLFPYPVGRAVDKRGLTTSGHLKKVSEPISGTLWSKRNWVNGEWTKISQHECRIFLSSLIC